MTKCPLLVRFLVFSLRSGKHRRRKRKYGGPHTQPKKKQQRSNTTTPTVMGVTVSSAHNSPLERRGSVHEGPCNWDAKRMDIVKKANDSGSAGNIIPPIEERKEENALDLKLNYHKETMSTEDVNAGDFSVQFHEPGALGEDGTSDALSKVECAETFQSSRCTGAKKRKSGSVRRFKQDSASSNLNESQNATAKTKISSDRGGRLGIQNPNFLVDDSGHDSKFEGSENTYSITEIIKPISYSTSVLNNVQDVSVMFLATRFVIQPPLFLSALINDSFVCGFHMME